MADEPNAEGLDLQLLEEMLKKAAEGDPAAAPWIQQIMARPDVAELLGNLAKQVELTVIGNLAGTDSAYREGVTQKLAQMRTELTGPNPTPLEVGLVERVVLNWLNLHDAELRLAQLGPQENKRADFWERRVNGAHRRYIASLKALATIRKLALPALQLNIARKQINVVGVAAE